MNWYRITFSTAHIKPDAFKNLLLDFTAAVGGSANSNELLLLSLIEEPAGTRTYYLTPEASNSCLDLIIKYSAVECARPDRRNLSLVAGGSFADLDNLYKE